MANNVQRQAVLDSIIAGGSVKQAAAAGTVSEKTVRRWLDVPQFAAEVAGARKAVSKRIMAAVTSRAVQATEVLEEIMGNQKASPYARVQAAKSILDIAFKAIETSEIIERIEQLERHAEEE